MLNGQDSNGRREQEWVGRDRGQNPHSAFPSLLDTRAVIAASVMWKWALAAILLFLGMIFSLLPDDIYLTMLLVIAITAIGTAGLIFILKVPQASTMYDAFAIFWAFTYGLGTLNTYFNTGPFEREMIQSGFISAQSFRGALLLIVFSISVLLALSAWRRDYLFTTITWAPREAHLISVMIAVFTLTAVAATASGKLGYQGDVSVAAGSSQISAFASLVAQGLAPAVGLAMFLVPSSSAKKRKVLLLCALVLLMVVFTQGRRQFLYSLVLGTIAYAAGGGSIRILHWKTVLSVAVMIGASQAASIGYLGMRLAAYEALPTDGIGHLLIEGAKNVINYDKVGLIETTIENQRERTFIVGYLAEVLGKVDTHPVAHGELLVDSFLISIPRVLYPDKGKLNFSADEALTHPMLGIPLYDGANTLLSGGVSDFGFLGGIAYAIAFAWLFALLARFSRTGGGAVYLLFTFVLLVKVLHVEEGIAGHFSAVRSAVLFAAMMWGAIRISNWTLGWQQDSGLPVRKRRFFDRWALRTTRRLP